MDEPIRRVQETTTQVGDTKQTTQDVIVPTNTKSQQQEIIARVIWYIAGILLVILAIRFVLVLLGANPYNGFASFIYGISHPFVAPFFGLFGYRLKYGVSRFETFTLVAMAIYALIAYGLVKLVTITKPQQ